MNLKMGPGGPGKKLIVRKRKDPHHDPGPTYAFALARATLVQRACSRLGIIFLFCRILNSKKSQDQVRQPAGGPSQQA